MRPRIKIILLKSGIIHFLSQQQSLKIKDEFLSDFAENIIIDIEIYNRQGLWKKL